MVLRLLKSWEYKNFQLNQNRNQEFYGYLNLESTKTQSNSQHRQMRFTVT